MNNFKQLKKDLRQHKNKWVFEEYTLNGVTYETKRFNNWFQIFRNKETKRDLCFPMCETQKAIFEHLKKYNIGVEE